MSLLTSKQTVNQSDTTIVHERDIPSLASGMTAAQAKSVHTELSFCLATSLAFFKCSTWEQTPWIPHMFDQQTTNPITAKDAHTIDGYLNAHSDTGVTAEMIQNSLLFASSYRSHEPNFGTGIGEYPHLFVIFPHAKYPIASNSYFLTIWHDSIVKPAFDRAWKDSGLAQTYGAEVDGMSRILPAAGSYTVNDAPPSKGIIGRLNRGIPGNLRAYWPAWTKDAWGRGTEGESAPIRAQVMNEAWDAITGMIKDHPDLADFQDPMLLAVCRGRLFLSPDMSAQAVYKNVGEEWDRFVDARYVVPRSFKVLLETVIEVKEEDQDEDEDDEESSIPCIGNVVGRTFKRMAVDEENEEYEMDEDKTRDGDGHQDKRRKTA